MMKDLLVRNRPKQQSSRKKSEQKKASKSKKAGQEKQKGKFVVFTSTTHLCCGIAYMHSYINCVFSLVPYTEGIIVMGQHSSAASLIYTSLAAPPPISTSPTAAPLIYTSPAAVPLIYTSPAAPPLHHLLHHVCIFMYVRYHLYHHSHPLLPESPI